MKDFHYQYGKYEFRVAPFDHLQEHERSWVIYRAYRHNYLQDADVEDYLYYRKMRLGYSLGFPLVVYPLLCFMATRKRRNTRLFNPSWLAPKLALQTFVMWYGWSYVNPGYRKYQKEKLKILQYLDNGMAAEMMRFNDLLPKYFTDNWVDGYLRRLYKQRNSWLTGILYEDTNLGMTVGPEREMSFEISED